MKPAKAPHEFEMVCGQPFAQDLAEQGMERTKAPKASPKEDSRAQAVLWILRPCKM